MVTVKMTEEEYKAYLLYLKSITMMNKAKKDFPSDLSLDEYLEDPENLKDFEAGLEDIKAGRIKSIDPDHLWESIK